MRLHTQSHEKPAEGRLRRRRERTPLVAQCLPDFCLDAEDPEVLEQALEGLLGDLADEGTHADSRLAMCWSLQAKVDQQAEEIAQLRRSLQVAEAQKLSLYAKLSRHDTAAVGDLVRTRFTTAEPASCVARRRLAADCIPVPPTTAGSPGVSRTLLFVGGFALLAMCGYRASRQ